MWTFRAAALAAGLTLTIPAGRLAAQIDYRNLDHGRPVAGEDAYPLERHAFELALPVRSLREPGGTRLHLLPLELEYGIFDNAQIGIGFPLGASEGAGAGTEWGLAGVTVSGFYNLNTESPVLPALAFGAGVALPVGSLAGSDARFSLKAIATHSWGLTRLHLNVARGFGSENQPGIEPAPQWSYGLTVDRTFFRQSLLLVGELVTQRVLRGAPVGLNAAAGVRYQVSPTLVLDSGVARRLRTGGGPDYDLTLGVSHAFGLSWLVPGGAR
ncbi:MAG TPA: transporter [Gemmatimonadales bacterium]|nr:transporter [Gemmatimonadales bacterium]